MMPEPKPKLEQLVEAQDQEAELDLAALEEMESQPEPTYRENADLSYKLDIPRDVDGLVKLLEEKKEIQESVNKIETSDFEVSVNVILFSAHAGMIPGLITALYGLYQPSVELCFAGWVVAIVGGVGGGLWYSDYHTNKSSKRKKFDQEKADQLQIKQNELLVVEKKLSCYEKSYNLDDIALVEDHGLGYSLGKVIQNSKEELVLRRTYHKLNRNALEAVDNRRWEGYSEEKPIANIISILKPSTQLSADDLRYIDEKTPILCVPSEADRPPLWSTSYGFVDNKRTDDIFRLHTIRNFQGPGEDWFKFSQVQEGKINAYLLVPEIKQRI